jgi:predicted MFS family arabinose efflux permease
MVIRAKEATDIAQSMLVTVWNLAIAGGGWAALC